MPLFVQIRHLTLTLILLDPNFRRKTNSVEQEQKYLERKLEGAEEATKREKAEVAALKGELAGLNDKLASGNEEGNHMHQIVTSVTREKARLQAACDLLKEELLELREENETLSDQVAVFGASSMETVIPHTPGATSSLFAELSGIDLKGGVDELSAMDQGDPEPSQDGTSTADVDPEEGDEEEDGVPNAPTFIRPWQPAVKKKGGKRRPSATLPVKETLYGSHP